MYTPYAGAAGMLLHINGKFTMEKLKSSLELHTDNSVIRDACIILAANKEAIEQGVPIG
jgi:hypothetical protein